MKAAVLVKQNAPLELYEVDIPRLDVGQVLVRVEYSGICGKQIDEITGRQGEDRFIPHLLGHEGGGTVVEVGPGVKKVKPGDRVVMHWIKGTGIDSAPPRFSYQGKTLSAGWVTTFSENSIVSENRLTPVSSDAGFDVMALLGCAVTTGLGIVFNNVGLKPGQSIAIFGVGGVGLNVVQGAALVNAYPVVVVDTTGVNAVRQAAYEATSDKGLTVFSGVPFAGDRMSIDSFPLHHGRRVVGSHGGDTVPDVDIPRYLDLYRLGKLELDQLISARFPLGEINRAVELVKGGQVCGRCLVETNPA